MIYQLVGLKCPYLDAYELPTPVAVPDLSDIQISYKRSIASNPEEAYKLRSHEKQCVLYGTFDDITGEMKVLDQPKVLFDLLPLFPAGFVAKKVSEAEERERMKKAVFEAQLKALENSGSKKEVAKDA